MKKLKARNPPLRNIPTKTPRSIIQVQTRDNAAWYKPQPSQLAKRYKCAFSLPNDGGPGSQLLDVSTLTLWNNGGIVCLILPEKSTQHYPTDPTVLTPGSLWNDGGIVAVVPPTHPNPAAPPLIWPNVTALGLLALGGADLPLTVPSVSGQLWNDGGWLAIARLGTVSRSDFRNDGGVLVFTAQALAYRYPTSPVSLSPGSLWNNGLTVAVVGPTTPNPSAAAIIFPNISALSLLSAGGANLPTSIPALFNQLWNNNGVVSIAPPYP